MPCLLWSGRQACSASPWWFPRSGKGWVSPAVGQAKLQKSSGCPRTASAKPFLSVSQSQDPHQFFLISHCSLGLLETAAQLKAKRLSVKMCEVMAGDRHGLAWKLSIHSSIPLLETSFFIETYRNIVNVLLKSFHRLKWKFESRAHVAMRPDKPLCLRRPRHL